MTSHNAHHAGLQENVTLRIAFVSPNREKLPDPVVPLGVLYMMAAAGQGHDKSLIDLCFAADPLETLDRAIAEFAPDLVAISMRNIQNADYTGTASTLGYYEDVVRTVRGRTRSPIVMGGGGFSLLPAELMVQFGLDFGFAGEGEEGFAELVRRLAAGRTDFTGIPGLYGPGGQPLAAPARGFMNIGQNILPERQWVDPRYYERTGIGSIQTKRGCPMHCDYCTYPTIEGRVIRKRGIADVADEWFAMLRDTPAIEHVFVVDAVFNLPPEYARELCRVLAQRGLETPWTCYLNPIRFDDELADAMAAARCAGVEIGSDSGTDAGLLRLRKGFTTQQIREASVRCRRVGIKDCHTFVLGVPGESLEDVERSLDFIESLDPYGAILMAYKDDREAVDPELAARLQAFRAEVLATIARRARGQLRWSVPSLGVRFNERLFDALRRGGKRGPLWQHVA